MNVPMISGLGSMPGTRSREALRIVRDLLSDNAIPYLPELPARGPGADLIGRTATSLVGLGVDLQPSGWRLTDGAGLDARRGQAYLREDLDELAEAFEGYAGPLKLHLAGPFTLAASLQLPRGERVLTDRGAVRDVTESLAESAAELLGSVRRLVPGAEVLMQWDEPSLPAVLAGSLPTASGYGRVRQVEDGEAVDGLGRVVDRLRLLSTGQLVHCCAPHVPVRVVRRVAGLGLALDASLLSPREWDGVADLVESGRALWAGIVPTDGTGGRPDQVAERLLRRWHEVGLTGAELGGVVLTPACGLADAAPADVGRTFALLREAAQVVGEAAERMSVR